MTDTTDLPDLGDFEVQPQDDAKSDLTATMFVAGGDVDASQIIAFAPAEDADTWPEIFPARWVAGVLSGKADAADRLDFSLPDTSHIETPAQADGFHPTDDDMGGIVFIPVGGAKSDAAEVTGVSPDLDDMGGVVFIPVGNVMGDQLDFAAPDAAEIEDDGVGLMGSVIFIPILGASAGETAQGIMQSVEPVLEAIEHGMIFDWYGDDFVGA